MAHPLPFQLVVDPQNNELLKKLREIETYDFDHITRSVQKKYGWDADKSRNAESETKKFFALSFLDPGHYHIPEIDVDEYWHRMILHTRFYIDFCNAIFGAYYHHMPEPNDNELNNQNRDRTLKLMPYWYGTTWDAVVHTCTQCRGPAILSDFTPHPSVMPTF